jgi:PKHD-type hydroxylase
MRERYQVWPLGLNTEQVDKITAIALRQPAEEATVFFSTAESIQGIRSCTVRWL